MGSITTGDSDCSHKIKRCLLLGRKAITNLDSIFKSRDNILLTKVCVVKAMIFPVVMYRCERWIIKKATCVLLLQSCLTLRDLMDCSPLGSPVHGDSPGKNTGVGCYALLLGIFPTQGLNMGPLCLLHWQAGSLPLAPPGKPRRMLSAKELRLPNCRINAFKC